MKVSVLIFGIARDAMGSSKVSFELPDEARLSDLRAEIVRQYPSLESVIRFAIAVNHAYAADETVLRESDEIALIPPVSGG